jgi:hypothetical protein
VLRLLWVCQLQGEHLDGLDTDVTARLPSAGNGVQPLVANPEGGGDEPFLLKKMAFTNLSQGMSKPVH